MSWDSNVFCNLFMIGMQTAGNCCQKCCQMQMIKHNKFWAHLFKNGLFQWWQCAFAPWFTGSRTIHTYLITKHSSHKNKPVVFFFSKIKQQNLDLDTLELYIYCNHKTMLLTLNIHLIHLVLSGFTIPFLFVKDFPKY